MTLNRIRRGWGSGPTAKTTCHYYFAYSSTILHGTSLQNKAALHNQNNMGGLSLFHCLVLQTIEIPTKDLRKQLDLLQKEHGFTIDARLYCFAMGLEMGANH